MADKWVKWSVKSEKKDGFGFGGRLTIVITWGLGERNLKAMWSNDSAEGVETGLTLR